MDVRGSQLDLGGLVDIWFVKIYGIGFTSKLQEIPIKQHPAWHRILISLPSEIRNNLVVFALSLKDTFVDEEFKILENLILLVSKI